MKTVIRDSTVIFVILIAFITFVPRVAAASDNVHMALSQTDLQSAAPTLIPTVSPSTIVDESTPEPRILPQVGSNAGLVIGASVLVLIIIGGVLGSRLRQKH